MTRPQTPGRPALLIPERVRIIAPPFAWLPCSLLTDGLLAHMSHNARALYFFLALAADRQGLSFYGDHRVHQLLGLSRNELCSARQNLIDLDLLAFSDGVYQLLSLPRRDLPTRAPAPTPRDTVAVQTLDLDTTATLGDPEISEMLARIMGRAVRVPGSKP